jgi:hypothetical protein
MAWTRTTPFRWNGNRDHWTVSWVKSARRYEVFRGGVFVASYGSASAAKRHAEQVDSGRTVCRECNGSGWVTA